MLPCEYDLKDRCSVLVNVLLEVWRILMTPLKSSSRIDTESRWETATLRKIREAGTLLSISEQQWGAGEQVELALSTPTSKVDKVETFRF